MSEPLKDSMLLAGLTQVEQSRRRMHSTGGETSRSAGAADEGPSLVEDWFRQLERKYYSKMESALAKEVDEQIAYAVSRECRSLRSQIESLQRDFMLMKAEAGLSSGAAQPDGPVPGTGAAPSPSSPGKDKRGLLDASWQGCSSPSPDAALPSASLNKATPEAEAIWAALDKHRQGVEEQVADLADWAADLQETLQLNQLEQRIQIVATGMLVFNATGMSEQERRVSLEALQGEEASLQEKMRTLREETQEDDTEQRAYSKSSSVLSEDWMTPSRSVRAIMGPSLSDFRVRDPERLGSRRRQGDAMEGMRANTPGKACT